MTFSIVGRCEKTGMFGVAITTSSICVGARCPHVRASVGAVASQNVTDPALGPAILDELGDGQSVNDALAKVVAANDFMEYRQLLVIDSLGRTASHTGKNILGTNAEKAGDNCLAAGNLLSTTDVPNAMAAAFEAGADKHLAPRLRDALAAGLAAGGEEGPVHSAALLVADKLSFPLVDLRVDWDDDDPVATLGALWDAYKAEMDAYVTRAVQPNQAPSYGVPGDE